MKGFTETLIPICHTVNMDWNVLTSAFSRHNKHISAKLMLKIDKQNWSTQCKETFGVMVNTKEDKTKHLQEQTQSQKVYMKELEYRNFGRTLVQLEADDDQET